MQFFPDHGWFIGTVVSVQDDLWHVLYHDGDEEDMELKEIQSLIIAEGNTNAKKCKLSVENEKQKVIKPLWTVQGIDPALFRPLQGVPNSKEMAQFYLFMYERQRIWERRSRGDPKPWSKNTIMETIHFCNVYRELDRGTAYFRSLLLDMPPAKNQREWTHKVLWMSYCYRQVNRVDSLQKTGLPEEDNLKPFFQKMRNDFQQTKQAFFTEAHQTTQYAKLEMHLRHTAGRLDPLVSVICDAESTLKDIHKALRGLRGIGKFLAWQIICDLQEGGCLAVDENFAVMGPGAKRKKMQQTKKQQQFVSHDVLTCASLWSIQKA